MLGLRLAATGLAAVLSFVLIERPIRRANWRPRPTLIGSLIATMAVAVAAVVVPVTIADDYWRAAPDDIAALAATASTIPPPSINTVEVVDAVESTVATPTASAVAGAGRFGALGGCSARWRAVGDGDHDDAGCHSTVGWRRPGLCAC